MQPGHWVLDFLHLTATILHTIAAAKRACHGMLVRLQVVAALHGGTAIPVGEAARGGGGGATGVKPPCAPVQGARM